MYNVIYNMCSSPGLRQRLTACVATLGLGNPSIWVEQNLWGLVPFMEDEEGTHWSAAYSYAEDTKTPNVNPDTGARLDVINDAMILRTVEAYIASTNVSSTDGLAPPVSS